MVSRQSPTTRPRELRRPANGTELGASSYRHPSVRGTIAGKAYMKYCATDRGPGGTEPLASAFRGGRDRRHALAVERIRDVEGAVGRHPRSADQQPLRFGRVRRRRRTRRARGHGAPLARRHDYRLRNPLTGPGCSRPSIVMTPFFLKTAPFFITNCTLRSASMSASGSP